MKTFNKDDNGKPMVSLVEPEYILGTARVLTFGANKYGIENWKLCEDRRRYIDALQRHLLAYQNGEVIDLESGESHLSHASCNLMFLNYFDALKNTSSQNVKVLKMETPQNGNSSKWKIWYTVVKDLLWNLK